jgi:hypothetical protein
LLLFIEDEATVPPLRFFFSTQSLHNFLIPFLSCALEKSDDGLSTQLAHLCIARFIKFEGDILFF